MKELDTQPATCVACNQQMESGIDDKTLQFFIHVCTNTKCRNYGLLAVTQEQMHAKDTASE